MNKSLLELIDEYAEARHTCGCWVYNAKTAAARQAVIAALNAACQEPAGEVVVTKTPEGEIVAVTRQDSEGRILSVIATNDA